MGHISLFFSCLLLSRTWPHFSLPPSWSILFLWCYCTFLVFSQSLELLFLSLTCGLSFLCSFARWYPLGFCPRAASLPGLSLGYVTLILNFCCLLCSNDVLIMFPATISDHLWAPMPTEHTLGYVIVCHTWHFQIKFIIITPKTSPAFSILMDGTTVYSIIQARNLDSALSLTLIFI